MGPKGEAEKQKREFVTGISVLVQSDKVSKASEVEHQKPQHYKHRGSQNCVFCYLQVFIVYCNIHLEY